jgi:hypothetical protein
VSYIDQFSKENDMTTQTYQIGPAPRLILGDCHGDLTIEDWNESAIEVESRGALPHVQQEGDTLTIEYAEADLRLRVPSDTTISVERVRGDVDVRGLLEARIERVDGDCAVAAVGNVAWLGRIDGDLEARDIAMLQLREVGGDTEARGIVTLECGKIGGDLKVVDAQSASFGDIGGDSEIAGMAEVLRFGQVGGDLALRGGELLNVAGGSIGGDAAIHGAGSAQLGEIGGDFAVNSVAGDLRLSNIGGDAAFNAIGGALHMGSIGGDASFHAIAAGMSIGNVGGDAALDIDFSADSITRLTVGGDARVVLPDQPNLTIRATVGGDVRGQRMASTQGGLFSVVYGEGAARLELVVGGDLELRGGGAPRSSSSAGGWDEHGDFAREMQRLGEEMGRLGEELGRELSEAFSGGSERTRRQAERARQRVEERMHETSERLRTAEERMRERSNDPRRVHVRINDREWRFDSERLERLKEQAREAARAGIAGAMEAVDRALAGIGAPPPRRTDLPPAPPAPPAPSAPPAPATGVTMRIDAVPPEAAQAAETAASPEREAGTAESAEVAAPDIETERAAILRMVAEGRISPEEGDMLLDALG